MSNWEGRDWEGAGRDVDCRFQLRFKDLNAVGCRVGWRGRY